ncbi:MAG: FMN-binding negative transcriptional regulator [Flavobacteriaceae bacterium]
MYALPYFKDHNPQAVFPFIKEHPFAFLTGSFSNGKPVATQVPMLLEEREGQWYLQGHIMRNTDHHKAFVENNQVLAVFHGPHTYVSATWYTQPHMGSTWNYMSVHAAGTLQFIPKESLITLMKKLTLHFEGNNPTSPPFMITYLPPMWIP